MYEFVFDLMGGMRRARMISSLCNVRAVWRMDCINDDIDNKAISIIYISMYAHL